MNYKVTAQYSRGEEKLIAEFFASHDASIFLTKKISDDQLHTKKRIYRLYGDSELLREFNEENIFGAYAQYAEGDSDFINQSPFVFNMTIQTINSAEEKNITNFRAC